MLEGLSFQFPKLGFLLFFFLACEALCPLRSNPIYFPRPFLFGGTEVRTPLWLWIAKWAMITFLIIAVMSPVRENETVPSEGYDVLLIVDPASADLRVKEQIAGFIARRPQDRIALWIPAKEEIIIPLTREHKPLASILAQVQKEKAQGVVSTQISRFFTTSSEGNGWAVILSNDPEKFVYSLPVGIQTSVVIPGTDPRWGARLDRDHPPYTLQRAGRYFEYYYVYPLFLGFVAMLIYLYGRNQKGLA